MGLMLSILIVCVGVIEALSCFEHFQNGVLMSTNFYESVRRGSKFLHYSPKKLKLPKTNEQPKSIQEKRKFLKKTSDSLGEPSQGPCAHNDIFREDEKKIFKLPLERNFSLKYSKEKNESWDKVSIVKTLFEKSTKPKVNRSYSMPEFTSHDDDFELTKIINELAIEPIDEINIEDEIEGCDSDNVAQEFDNLFVETEKLHIKPFIELETASKPTRVIQTHHVTNSHNVKNDLVSEKNLSFSVDLEKSLISNSFLLSETRKDVDVEEQEQEQKEAKEEEKIVVVEKKNLLHISEGILPPNSSLAFNANSKTFDLLNSKVPSDLDFCNYSTEALLANVSTEFHVEDSADIHCEPNLENINILNAMPDEIVKSNDDKHNVEDLIPVEDICYNLEDNLQTYNLSIDGCDSEINYIDTFNVYNLQKNDNVKNYEKTLSPTNVNDDTLKLFQNFAENVINACLGEVINLLPLLIKKGLFKIDFDGTPFTYQKSKSLPLNECFSINKNNNKKSSKCDSNNYEEKIEIIENDSDYNFDSQYSLQKSKTTPKTDLIFNEVDLKSDLSNVNEKFSFKDGKESDVKVLEELIDNFDNNEDEKTLSQTKNSNNESSLRDISYIEFGKFIEEPNVKVVLEEKIIDNENVLEEFAMPQEAVVNEGKVTSKCISFQNNSVNLENCKNEDDTFCDLRLNSQEEEVCNILDESSISKLNRINSEEKENKKFAKNSVVLGTEETVVSDSDREKLLATESLNFLSNEENKTDDNESDTKNLFAISKSEPEKSLVISTISERNFNESEKSIAPQAFWLIFSGEYTKAMSKDWHSGHFSCWQCDEALTGQRYVLRDEHPYCIKCYESVFANVCEECNKIIGIDSKDLSYKDKHWHEACFLCNKCRVSLVDKQFGSKAEKIYCGNCYDAQFASRCDGCSEIFRAGTKKMEYKTRQWHEKCFSCCVCKTPIGTKSFIPREQEIYCATCYEEKFATRCVKCNKIITSGGVTYKNEPWHRECFTCTNCNTSLAGQRFTSREEKPYCADCFGELFAKRCTSCNRPITGIGGTRFISFEDRHWHNDCFICASCKTSLVGRGFITDGDDIICPECAKQKLM